MHYTGITARDEEQINCTPAIDTYLYLIYRYNYYFHNKLTHNVSVGWTRRWRNSMTCLSLTEISFMYNEILARKAKLYTFSVTSSFVYSQTFKGVISYISFLSVKWIREVSWRPIILMSNILTSQFFLMTWHACSSVVTLHVLTSQPFFLY